MESSLKKDIDLLVKHCKISMKYRSGINSLFNHTHIRLIVTMPVVAMQKDNPLRIYKIKYLSTYKSRNYLSSFIKNLSELEAITVITNEDKHELVDKVCLHSNLPIT